MQKNSNAKPASTQSRLLDPRAACLLASLKARYPENFCTHCGQRVTRLASDGGALILDGDIIEHSCHD